MIDETPKDKNTMLTEHEVAHELRLAVATLRRWRWEGRPPRYHKFGRSVRYDPTTIEAFKLASERASTSDHGTEAA